MWQSRFRRMTSWRNGCVVLLGLLLPAGGCDRLKPELAPVRGKVYYNGVPLPRGTIVFVPDPVRGRTGPLSHGEIQPDGSFTLWSEKRPGAQVGWHRVTVVAVDTPTRVKDGQRLVVPRSLLPEKYRNPELAGLSCEVKAGRENSLDFHLE
jgi:hypothetical protein